MGRSYKYQYYITNDRSLCYYNEMTMTTTDFVYKLKELGINTSKRYICMSEYMPTVSYGGQIYEIT